MPSTAAFPLPTTPLHIGVAQAQAIAGDLSTNIAKVVQLLEQAADQGAQILLLPEKFLSGYEPALIAAQAAHYAIGSEDERLQPIREVCQRRRIAAIIGAASYEREQLSISSLVLDQNGQLLTRYHKQQLFDSEKEHFRPGEQACFLDIQDWRLGLAICYDCAFPEHARYAARHGCHAYLVSALFSMGNGYHESRTWLPARALDNNCYVLLSNHIGHTGGWHSCGSSAIWQPDGRLLAEAGTTEQAVLVVELSPSVLQTARTHWHMLTDSVAVPLRAVTQTLNSP
ncbi:carbon-nitrogen hydrolase family protein [Neisseriaceae bacterium TC5R-5]|nr:carbon-nitrogen hydrolase family protein [Neisseriaceae bacterium TC5R-5]